MSFIESQGNRACSGESVTQSVLAKDPDGRVAPLVDEDPSRSTAQDDGARDADRALATLNSRAILALVCVLLPAATSFAARLTADRINNKPDAWLSSDEGIQQIDNIITWQNPDGGWAKGYDATQPHKAGQPYGVWDGVGTIDNNFTTTELALLAHVYTLTHRPEMLESFNRGIDYLLKAQYPVGGWPQRFPLQDNYGRDITFNDNAMVNVLRLFQDITKGRSDYAFVDPDRRAKVKDAFDRGIDCILKLQIVVNGKPTAWAQQYDPQTLEPAAARSYELPGISGSESASIVKLLMSLDNPSPQVQAAIRNAASWFAASKITGKKVIKQEGGDVVVVDDPTGEPLWARYYDIETNRPFYCGRDGVKKWSLAEVEPERRRGYAWLRPWGATVLEQYAKWSAKHPG
jgi:PelA/Pel-15E family pectate lyase